MTINVPQARVRIMKAARIQKTQTKEIHDFVAWFDGTVRGECDALDEARDAGEDLDEDQARVLMEMCVFARMKLPPWLRNRVAAECPWAAKLFSSR